MPSITEGQTYVDTLWIESKSKPALTKYTIRDYAEETACEQCGYPLYPGDIAYLASSGSTYCSKVCAGKGEECA